MMEYLVQTWNDLRDFVLAKGTPRHGGHAFALVAVGSVRRAWCWSPRPPPW